MDVPVRIDVPGATARQLTVSFADGHQEAAGAADLFYWPPGHTVKAEADTEMILFSPQHEHSHVIDHILKKLERT